MKTMTKETLTELVSVCREYNPFASMIDDYRREQRVRERNKKAEQTFIALVSPYVDGVVCIPYGLDNKGIKTEDAVREWLARKGIEVKA